MPLVGVTTKATPLQVTVLMATISGVGFNVTVNVKTVPIQPPETVLGSMI